MTPMTHNQLLEHTKATAETIRAYAHQIESGEYDDEPTVDDTPLSEYALEIVAERGREYAIIICTGGPQNFEVAADGLGDARLEGYWAGEHVTLTGEHFNTFLDWFIERE